ncbi:unnamed protein product [Mytilus coruscus]|uniref:HTH psq-type domain-containing protein n=1 Tax=Mytilus coruscus TaxID=42192 RepID=A0A6J8D961_MYTCO|nr:unnamed protein product [Mytilus coruscus]
MINVPFERNNRYIGKGGKAKYRTYSPSALTRAYSAVHDDKFSIRKASQSYGVQFQTLRDRVSGNVVPECCTMGNAPCFTSDEESRVDEKGVTINHNPSRVVSGVETSPQEVTSGKGDTVTNFGCGNAIGNALPPYFVFPGQRMNDQLLEGSTPGTVGTVSKTGCEEVGRKNGNESVVSDREVVESNKENEGVVSDGQIGFEVGGRANRNKSAVRGRIMDSKVVGRGTEEESCIVVHTCSNGKESEIDEALSDFLRHAPHQAGGLKYKKPAQADNIPPSQVTTHQQPL